MILPPSRLRGSFTKIGRWTSWRGETVVSAPVAVLALVVAVLLGVAVPTPGAAQPAWFDSGAFFVEDEERSVAAFEALAESPRRIWLDEGVVDWYRHVLAEGTDMARAALSWHLVFFGGNFLPADALDTFPAAFISCTELREILGISVELPVADAFELIARGSRNYLEFGEALPELIASEAARVEVRGWGERGPDRSVLAFLLAGAAQWQEMGSAWARAEAGKALEAIHPDPWAAERRWASMDPETAKACSEMDRAIARTGRMAPLSQTLERLPDPLHPVEGRVLDATVRDVAVKLLDEQIAEGMEMVAAHLLAFERPLAPGSVERVFHAHCVLATDECEPFLQKLYAGPDDPSLSSIHADVEEMIVTGLREGAQARRQECARRQAALEADDGRSSSRGRLEGVDRFDDRIWENTRKIRALMDLTRVIEAPSSDVLDAVLSYWMEERDAKASEILVDAGMLEAGPLGSVASASATGNCLAPQR